ncbi:MAG TPA: homocysteine S-methyltransferase family protein [Candidatus Hydrogenedentes bacterium]|nr:homocysteine S-methyltransferase family protein [Candidatus Hydrogenedentota bacterium]HQE81558.1 homocysteine S-methyltransferase family protein [Candidatus Hydrogenedentota bacterium]HQH68705.1 homocysteine S-methyltransferase family protein [Candidatus Hydrogenedentota bacterium]HQM48569.1 homocysteine S-methyltransferase family protein [Candidatus Hydrogenedentota bacterium]
MQFDPNVKLTRQNIKELPPLCTDGAWGTEMAKRGGDPGYICDVWNLERPDAVFAVAKDYVDAGAQVILTNTFNSNPIALNRHLLANKAAELNRLGAEISKRAAKGKAYVFASIGPCGKMVMMGDIDPAVVEEAAARQAHVLEAGGADAIVIETQSDIVEAEAILKGALRGCSLPVGVSFTFDSGENNDKTMMGVSIAQAYAMAKVSGASFVGANCGAGIETFPNIARQYAACGADLPIWIKGNAGLPETDGLGNMVFRAGPEIYAQAVPELLEAGARFIGGCCGSTPDHVRAIAKAMA